MRVGVSVVFQTIYTRSIARCIIGSDAVGKGIVCVTGISIFKSTGGFKQGRLFKMTEIPIKTIWIGIRVRFKMPYE